MKNFKITRTHLEILSLIIIVVFCLSVFTLTTSSQGVFSYDGGKIKYVGSIVNHHMTGKGKLTYENGDYYKGDFVNGVFEGKGTFVSVHGWSYTGDFKKGQPDGQGRLNAKNKKVYKGTFKQGIYQK
ncbi:TPA: hypothetical protein ACINYL_001982 [Streptococcus agalactiae]